MADRPVMKPRIGEWEEIDGCTHLLATRCACCGEAFFPARRVCLRGCAGAMEDIKLTPPARLTDFTVIHQVPSGFCAPLVAGYGEFEPGVSVFAPIDATPEQLQPGTLLDVHIGPIRVLDEGETLVAYRFRVRGQQ